MRNFSAYATKAKPNKVRSKIIIAMRNISAYATMPLPVYARPSLDGRTKVQLVCHPPKRKGGFVQPPFLLERVMRIELTTTAWEAVVLPLNYTRTSEQTPLTVICVHTQISTTLRCSSSFLKNLALQSFLGVLLFSFTNDARNKLC